jgi:Phage gp6-like head-tail connector protein
MKLSQVQISDLKQYANVYHNADDNLFATILMAAKQFIVTYTGLQLYDLDPFEDLTVALFVLTNEMYDNRDFTVENVKVNFVVKQILDSHSVNYL